MAGTQPNASASGSSPGLTAAPPPGANPLLRLAAKVRLPAATREAFPPTDDALIPLYVELLAADKLDGDARARVCRALAYHAGDSRRFVPAYTPFYVEAVCAFSDDPRCVLFVLSLLFYGGMDAYADLPFSQGVYAAALFFESWEGSRERTHFGLPPYSELRRHLAALYVADAETLSPERTELVEAVYTELGLRGDTPELDNERGHLAHYLTHAHAESGRGDAWAQNVRRAAPRRNAANDDPFDDSEMILRGGSGDPQDDLRIAERYVAEERDLDAAACALFARCVSYAENEGDDELAGYWTTKLAAALIAVDRVDEDTQTILSDAVRIAPTPLLELASVYAGARSGASDAFAGDPEAAHRLERVVLDKSDIYKPLARARSWDWLTLERALALSWGHRGRTDGAARALYKQVVDAAPDDKLLAVLYARALAQANIYDKTAVIAYERAIEIGKGSEPVRRALALAYAQTDAAKDPARRDAATRLWEEMYRTGGMADDPAIVGALADVYAEVGGDSDVAVILWEKTARSDPKNGTVRLRLARELRGRGDLPGALALYKEATKLLPDDFDAFYEAGLLLRDTGGDADAAKFLKKATALPGGTRHVEAHFALAEVLLATDNRADAKAILEKIVESLDPTHQPSLLALAQSNLRYEEGGARRAETLLEKALTLHPDDANAYKRLALLHEEQGRLADAEAALEHYLALSPPDPTTMRKLAGLYLKRGDFVKAEAALRQTVALGGGDKKLFTQLGDVIQQAQKQRDAERTGQRKPGDAPIPTVVPGASRPRPAVSPVPVNVAPPAPIPPAVSVPSAVPVDTTPPAPRRQSLVTQNTLSTAAPVPDSPAAQNLTRSVGAAAIKAALRNRAARLAQSADATNKENETR